MRLPMLFTAGLAFPALLLALPAAHLNGLGQPVGGLTLVLMGLPLLALVVQLIRPRLGLGLWGLPAAHLPALIAAPTLTGPLVYEGVQGLVALLALGIVAVFWTASIVRIERAPHPANPEPGLAVDPAFTLPKRGLERWIPWLAAGVGAIIFAVFCLAALDHTVVRAVTANVTIATGLLLSWLVATRHIVDELGEPLINPAARQQILASAIAARRRPKRITRFVIEIGTALAAIGLWSFL